MKKKIITAILAISCIGLSAGSELAGAATVQCSTVSPTMVGAAAATRFVQLKNESGSTCGTDWLNGSIRQFYVSSTTDSDGQYAAILTALSLQKKMLVYVANDAISNSLLATVAIKN